MNIPNGITLARIALVPGVVALLWFAPDELSWQRFLAMGLFVLAASTDGLDGAVARKRNQVTNLGKILDPIADKALIGSVLVTLSLLDEIQWWITGAILFRELAVTIYRVLVVKKNVIPATASGKLKTVLQVVAISAVIAPFELWLAIWSQLELILILTALVATVYSGVEFILKAKRN